MLSHFNYKLTIILWITTQYIMMHWCITVHSHFLIETVLTDLQVKFAVDSDRAL